LRSKNREYPVVHNIPCLIPELGSRTNRDLPLWQKHQSRMWREYKGGDEGVFTRDSNEMGRHVGEIIARAGGGLYLDVGCGAKPWPVYMVASSASIEWVGIDPFLGDAARQFPFVQGLGEYLPFKHKIFYGALFASTIYHQLDPRRSLLRVHDVLKPGGQLYIWYTNCKSRRKYWTWRGLRILGFPRMYNEDFQWAFTQGSLRTELKKTGFSVHDTVFLCEGCADFIKCRHRNEYLVIARRE
jgi:SAM-dependent methyltransferase